MKAQLKRNCAHMLLVAIKNSVKNINKDSLCMHFTRDPALRRSLKGTQKHLLCNSKKYIYVYMYMKCRMRQTESSCGVKNGTNDY